MEADSGQGGVYHPFPFSSPPPALSPGSALGQRSSLSLAAALAGVRGVGRRPGRPSTRMPECEDVITIMRDPAGIQGFQPFVDMSSGPRTRALPHPSPSTRPCIFPSPVLVCTQSSLQPQEMQLLQGLQTHYKLEPGSPMGPGSGSWSPTVGRGEAAQERGEGRVDSPWGPWLPAQRRPYCVLAPRAPRLQLPGRLRRETRECPLLAHTCHSVL